VGLIGVVVGSVFVSKGFSEQSTANANYAKYCPCPSMTDPNYVKFVQPDDQAAPKDKTLGAAFLGIGGAALVTGVALIIVGKPKPPPASSSAIHLTPWFSGTAGGFRGTF
jgi:hypothetical protein